MRGKVFASLALGAALALAGTAGHASDTSASQAAKPFKYTYRVTDLTVEAQYTAFGAKATSRLWLDGPSKMKWVSWFGPNPKRLPGTLISVAALYLTGEATYSSLDPSCASSLEYKTSKSHPVRSSFLLDTRNPRRLRLRVEVQKFPIARAFPGKDGGPEMSEHPNRCGKALVRWYDEAEGVLPTSAMTRPSFVFTDSLRLKLEEFGETIEWTLRMTVKRIRYHLIDCATESGC